MQCINDFHLHVKLCLKIALTRVRGSVEKVQQSLYKISYQPNIKGRHQLHIKVEGQHIKGSPFLVNITGLVEELIIPIMTIHEVKRPMAVAVNQSGEVIVAESDGSCISIFTPSGERLRSFGTRGCGEGLFKSPRGVAVDSEDNILVADINHCIQKFMAS